MEFKKFDKMARLSRDVIVTEKIDGTNAQIYITPENEILAGSRNRWITPDNDNYGFAKWVEKNKDELLTLGPGRHFGEWWGSGIQRGYGLKDGERYFSLFNVSKYTDNHPKCCKVVPVCFIGNFDILDVDRTMNALKTLGSFARPGYMNPEGIVIYHTAANVLFKKTFDNDNGKFNK